MGRQRVRPARWQGEPPASRARAQRRASILRPVAPGRRESLRAPWRVSTPSCRSRRRIRVDPGLPRARARPRRSCRWSGVCSDRCRMAGESARPRRDPRRRPPSPGDARDGPVPRSRRVGIPTTASGLSCAQPRHVLGPGNRRASSAPNRPSARFQPAASRSAFSRRPDASAPAISRVACACR